MKKYAHFSKTYEKDLVNLAAIVEQFKKIILEKKYNTQEINQKPEEENVNSLVFENKNIEPYNFPLSYEELQREPISAQEIMNFFLSNY